MECRERERETELDEMGQERDNVTLPRDRNLNAASHLPSFHVSNAGADVHAMSQKFA